MKWWMIPLLVVLLSRCGKCQTICVEPELQVVPDRAAQFEVERLLRDKGAKIDCLHYDYAVSFYLVTGADYTGTTYYSAQFSRGINNTFQASVLTYKTQYNYGLWVVSIRNKGDVETITRQRSVNLQSAVNGVVKTLKKHTA